MIHLTKVTKNFKNQNVLKELDLLVDQNSTIYIKGTNGSGKSTLLKVIAKLVKPNQGNVELGSENVGALIENPAFIEEQSISNNLKFLFNIKDKFDLNSVKELTEYFELDLDDKKPLKKYSVGMRQKTGIIQAIMENQEILLFDEPTRGLDSKSVAKFDALINDFHKKKTIVICAHDGVEGIDFDQNYELVDGRLVKI